MNATRPEADTEYSRGLRASDGDSAQPNGPQSRHQRLIRIAVLAGGLIGAGLLLVAEFTPLLHVHSSASNHVVKTVNTGSHHSYALVPIALLAAALSYGIWQTRNRLALLAIGFLGAVALLIALLGDLPDAHASGLIGSAATKFATASSSAAIGLYLETLGAVVLLITAATGLLLLGAPEPRQRPRDPARASRTRSAS
jgi:hypothetical protein